MNPARAATYRSVMRRKNINDCKWEEGVVLALGLYVQNSPTSRLAHKGGEDYGRVPSTQTRKKMVQVGETGLPSGLRNPCQFRPRKSESA